LKVAGVLGEAEMTPAIYNPILDYLADHKPRTLGQIEQAVKEKGIVAGQVLQAMLILIGAGHVLATQDEAASAKAKPHTDKLNAHLVRTARSRNEILFLSSPVTGGGYNVSRFQQIFLLALQHGKTQPAEWVQFAWQILASQGQKLVKEGTALESVADNIAELTAQADTFAERQLPILKALQIA